MTRGANAGGPGQNDFCPGGSGTGATARKLLDAVDVAADLPALDALGFWEITLEIGSKAQTRRNMNFVFIQSIQLLNPSYAFPEAIPNSASSLVEQDRSVTGLGVRRPETHWPLLELPKAAIATSAYASAPCRYGLEIRMVPIKPSLNLTTTR